MSQKNEKLPTAAKVTSVGGTPKEGAAIQNFVQIYEGDKLVLRKDVEKLIKDKKNKIEKRKDGGNLVLSNKIRLLEELLEEIQE